MARGPITRKLGFLTHHAQEALLAFLFPGWYGPSARYRPEKHRNGRQSTLRNPARPLALQTSCKRRLDDCGPRTVPLKPALCARVIP
jgi:hypothetical protein